MTYEELWLRARPRLEGQLRRRLGRTLAQDIADEAFDRLQRRGQQPTPANLWAHARDAERDILRDAAKQDFLAEQAGILDGRAIPTIEGAMFRADFDRAFRALPEEQRIAFALTELRGLTERETADVLGVNQSTVNRRCEAARTYLQKELS